MILVVDTHALVWYLSASPKLSSKAKAALQNPQNSIVIP